HVLVYEEPEALRRLNAILISAEGLLARTESGESAVGVLLSKDSGKSARALLAALDALGRAAEKPGPADGLLPALLFDPEYRPVARDLQLVARNFREISEKLARGEGLLGGMLQDSGQDGMGQACAFAAPKAGTCPDCARLGNFVALVEERVGPSRTERPRLAAGARPMLIGDIAVTAGERVTTGIGELDRVLGGGVVPGSLV